MTDPDRHALTNGRISASVKADGAELCSLCDAAGRELLWQAGPAWPRHAPVLFPIVGRLTDGRLIHRGRAFPLTQHGFARDRRFTWVDRGTKTCRLALADDAETRARYPFAFRFEVAYTLEDDTLVTTYTIANPGDEVLPASAGAHPAFRWPLVDGIAKEAHRLEFDRDEPAPIRRLTGGLIATDSVATPIQGRILPLTEGLFAADALILDQPASRSVCFTAPGAPGIAMSWDGFTQLGIWTRPPGDFLCIEPWHGMASPVDFAGEFLDKPGLLLIPPGERRMLTHWVKIS
ncbi:MAG TPA: aldose 1-epimerase family protein [Stellaceae bacterium]|nr:aldose 1-epimerase family protein [Stellaceae bacterium]